MKGWLLNFLLLERYVRMQIRLSRWLYRKLPLLGRPLSFVVDRLLLLTCGLDVMSFSIDVRELSISHPVGVLLGGNGIRSSGRVAVMAGVKFVGRSPSDPEYLRRHAEQRVFQLGDNVVIGANSVVVGPLDICDNVVIAAMSLVNRSITEPGLYGGIPARKLREGVTDEWVSHLPT